MIDNIISLPRPRAMRPGPESLGLYLRAGRNDRKELLNMLASGGTTCFGVVVEAVHAERHRELREEALRRDLDVVLDPKTQAMAFPGAHTEVMAQLPWGLDRHHRIEDFRGAEATSRITALADFVLEHGFTQVLAPTHLLQGANDPWLGRDVAAAGVLREALAGSREQIPIIYSLALPIQALRDPVQRRLIIRALRDAPMDALWLKVENFGSDASPAKAGAYIEAASDFHSLGVPIIADHAGGRVGLALLAFSAVSGMRYASRTLQRRALAPRAHGRRRPLNATARLRQIVGPYVEARPGADATRSFTTGAQPIRGPRYALLPSRDSRHA